MGHGCPRCLGFCVCPAPHWPFPLSRSLAPSLFPVPEAQVHHRLPLVCSSVHTFSRRTASGPQFDIPPTGQGLSKLISPTTPFPARLCVYGRFHLTLAKTGLFSLLYRSFPLTAFPGSARGITGMDCLSSSPNPYDVILTPKVMVLEGGAFGRK